MLKRMILSLQNPRDRNDCSIFTNGSGITIVALSGKNYANVESGYE